ncbi:hypothetical protein FOC1_g10007042 [Fusarium oxysporum f. sp. cubense race 1]|uniref:Uncharacterized protein n=1 Tax=Fusarium oxysporum f. sp. cubense (strain race 1) TaxID=1229664 RepID=N4U792_FUSC1|nr:hypothetical protein FOC1_g10007042 [Fusarium oxysporum f. sp. cubense race 1]
MRSMNVSASASTNRNAVWSRSDDENENRNRNRNRNRNTDGNGLTSTSTSASVRMRTIGDWSINSISCEEQNCIGSGNLRDILQGAKKQQQCRCLHPRTQQCHGIHHQQSL